MPSHGEARFATARFAIEPSNDPNYNPNEITPGSRYSSAKAKRPYRLGAPWRSGSSASIFISSITSIFLGTLLMLRFSGPTDSSPFSTVSSLPSTNFVHPDGVLVPTFTTAPAYRTPLGALLAYHIPSPSFLSLLRIRRTNPAGFLAGDSQNPCWCFHGTTGTVAIALNRPVPPSHIVIKRYRTPFSGAMPQLISVWGLIDSERSHQKLSRLSPSPLVMKKDGHAFARIAIADYQTHTSNILPVDEGVVDAGIEFPVFMVSVQNNQDASATCIGTIEIRG